MKVYNAIIEIISVEKENDIAEVKITHAKASNAKKTTA
jgi:hypothetical protein